MSERGFSLGALPGCWSRRETNIEGSGDEKAASSVQCGELLEEVMDATAERAALEAERAFLNQRVIDTAHLNIKPRASSLFSKEETSRVCFFFLL